MDRDHETALPTESGEQPQSRCLNLSCIQEPRSVSTSQSASRTGRSEISDMTTIDSSFATAHSSVEERCIASPGEQCSGPRRRAVAYDNGRQAPQTPSIASKRPLCNASENGPTSPDLGLETANISLDANDLRPAGVSQDTLRQLLSLLSEMPSVPPNNVDHRVSKTRPGPSTRDNLPRCWEHGCGGRPFYSFRNYTRHIAEQRGLDSAVCTICGTTFTRKSNRDKHQRACLKKKAQSVD